MTGVTYDISKKKKKKKVKKKKKKKKKKKSHSDWGGKWGGKASNWGGICPPMPPPLVPPLLQTPENNLKPPYNQWMTTRGSYVHKIVGGIPKILSFFLLPNIHGFRQNNSQGF